MTAQTSNERRPAWRKLAVALLAPMVMLLGAELALWLAGFRPVLYDEDPYVGFSSQVPLYVEQEDESGTPVWRTAPNKLGFFNDQSFALDKSPGTTRIFCVGGSTTYGRPYDDATSFPGWLRALLSEADPTRQWEVINAGGISYASYRVAMLMEELIRYEPDLFIIYSGQNEFLEQRTYGEILSQSRATRWMSSVLNRTRIGTALRGVLQGRGAPQGSDDGERTLLSGEVKTRLDDVVGPEAYERDDALTANILAHYRHNLERMVDIARSGGAEVLLVVPGSNLRDCAPFKSVVDETLSEEGAARVATCLEQARALQAAERWQDSLPLLETALALDPRHAHLHYYHGRALDRLGRAGEAAVAYQRALDEDVCPLRALSSMLPIVHEVGEGRGVPVVDYDAALRLMASPSFPDVPGVPGDDLFLDHVHPTIEAHRRLALALLDELIAQGALQPAASFTPEVIERIRLEVEGSVDSEMQAQALLNLSKVLGWAGKHSEARRLAEKALALAPRDATILYNLAIALWNSGEEARAVEHYRQVLALVPEHVESLNNLGFALQRRGRVSEAIELYEKALLHDPEHVRALINLGNVLAKSGRSAEAIPMYERALTLDPSLAQIQNNLGNALCGVGRIDEGVARYRNAIELNPEHASAHNNLGNALLHLGAREEAIEHFRAALASKPEFEAARASLERALAGG